MTNKTKKSTGVIRLLKLMLPYIWQLIFCLMCVVVANIAVLAKPYIAEVIIDDFFIAKVPQKGIYSILGLSIAYFGISLIGAGFNMMQMRMLSVFGQNILHDLRRRVVTHILHMPVNKLDSYGSGRLITRATNDVETINEFYSDILVNLFRDIVLLTGLMVVMIQMDAQLALIAFIGIPLILLVSVSIRKVLKNNWKKMKATIGRINGFFSENISGMRIVQAFNRQLDKLREFRELNKEYYRLGMIQLMLHSALRPVMEIINSLVIALLIAWSYNRVSGGLLEVGVLYAFTTYVKQFFEPINELSEMYTTIQSALVSADRIFTLLDDDGQEEPEAGTVEGPVKGEIEFKDVWFAYNPGEWVLKGVNFKVKPGEKVAFVGATGSGKTTIINLISRYYHVQKGEVLIDGKNVEDWKLRNLRRDISVVLQDVFLFVGSVADNVRMHNKLTDSEVREALEVSCASEFIDDLGGPDFHVSEAGLNFSTGQRQLLSFARAVASKPKVLVLDEATAHIDTNTEQLVQRSIEQISKGRTSIFIAHRLSTIMGCDRIYVLKDGVIAESGNHTELMEKGGLYADLVKAQE